MKSFKEWLSDNLRYIILVLAVLLALEAVFLGVKLYESSRVPEGDPDSVRIIDVTETETEEKTEKATESGTEAESETETETAAEAETESETEKQTASGGAGETTPVNGQASNPGTTGGTGTQNSTGNSLETQSTDRSGDSGTNSNGSNTSINNSNGTTDETSSINNRTAETQEIVIETDPPQTEAPQTEAPEPIYMTLNHACYIRSYADYGDNIIGEYSAGTVVEFLEDVGGWYKVQIDGMVGYMGARFLS